jgi:hypothetical protein
LRPHCRPNWRPSSSNWAAPDPSAIRDPVSFRGA